MRRTFIILAVLILIGGCIGSEPKQQTQSSTTSTTEINTDTVLETPENGDLVSIHYTVTWNNEVYDSTLKEKAESSPHKELIQSMHIDGFEPLIFTVDMDSKDPIKNFFSITVNTMKPGDNKKISKAAELFGWTHDEERIQTQPRSFTVPIEESVSLERFQELFEKTPDIGMQISWYKHWNSTVTDIETETVLITHNPLNGSTFNGLGGSIEIKSGEKTITTTFNPELGKTFLSPDSRYITYTRAAPTEVTVDYNHPLAGKTVEIEITLNNITRQ